MAQKARKEAQREDKPSEDTDVTSGSGQTNGTKHKRPADVGDEVEDNGDSKITKKAKGENGEEIKTKSGEGPNGYKTDTAKGDAEGESGHGKPGSKERLPKEGQTVHWKVGRNWTEGKFIKTIVRVLEHTVTSANTSFSPIPKVQ